VQVQGGAALAPGPGEQLRLICITQDIGGLVVIPHRLPAVDGPDLRGCNVYVGWRPWGGYPQARWITYTARTGHPDPLRAYGWRGRSTEFSIWRAQGAVAAPDSARARAS